MDDLISRQEAIDRINGYFAKLEWLTSKGMNLKYIAKVGDVAGILNSLSSVQPEQRWIPCSERLPEEEGLYLVSVKNDHERRYSKTCQYMGRNHWFARQDVEAWMPLPEPYGGE